MGVEYIIRRYKSGKITEQYVCSNCDHPITEEFDGVPINYDWMGEPSICPECGEPTTRKVEKYVPIVTGGKTIDAD